MPIDTSSYYPEVPDPEGNKKEGSLNSRNVSLFGEKTETVTVIEENDIKNDDSHEAPKSSKNLKSSGEEGWERGVTLFSNFLSWALVPLLMPVYGILFIFKLSVLDVVAPAMQTAFTFIVLGINFVIPVLLIMLLKFLGIVQDVGLNGQRERLIPYVITALCMGGTAWFMGTRGAPVWVCMFYTGGAVAAVINLFINLRWKISAHAAAIAGIIALLVRLEKDVAAEPELFVWLLITVGAAGLLGSARIWLGRHTVWQVLAGFVVGFCSVFFLMAIH